MAGQLHRGVISLSQRRRSAEKASCHSRQLQCDVRQNLSKKFFSDIGKRPNLLITRMETNVNCEQTMTLQEVEYELIEWADSVEDEVIAPVCLSHWDLNEEQLEIIKEACANPYAAASIANAMWCITDNEALSSIAELLRTY